MRRYVLATLGVSACIVTIVFVDQARTQAQAPAKVDCKVAECAQLMVEISNKLMSENAQIKKRLSTMEGDIEGVRQLIPAAKADFHNEIDRLVAVRPTTPNKSTPAQKDDTGKFANEGTVVFPLRCDEGQVAVGIDLTLGGTCHEQCNGDGRPVQQFKVVCRALQIAK
jgi:hypothetical protein